MPQQPIVVGVDGSPASVRAAALGWRLAEGAGAPCLLVHAVPDVWMETQFVETPLYGPELERILVEDARAQIAPTLAGAVPEAALRGLEIRVGRVPLVLAAVARKKNAAFVVVGGKHHGALARGLGGSTAHYLVRALDVPLLVAGPGERPVGRVLAAVDLSEAAPGTLATAHRVARLLGAELRLLHVVEPIRFPTVVPVTLDAEKFHARSVAEFERLVAPLGDVAAAERVVRRGTAAEAVEAEAEAWGADLVVVGSHGKRWLDRLLVGSTTERLLNTLTTSLLIVPAARAAARPSIRSRRPVGRRTRRKGMARHESR